MRLIIVPVIIMMSFIFVYYDAINIVILLLLLLLLSLFLFLLGSSNPSTIYANDPVPQAFESELFRGFVMIKVGLNKLVCS